MIDLFQDKKTPFLKPNQRGYKLILIQFVKMGNHQNKDSRVRLYITTSKPLIYAGQYLQATAHAQVLEDTPYQSINISLVGKEKVQWSETYQKLLMSYKNERQTYRQEMTLDVFENGLKKGHYSFPFNMLIPSSLPASMKLDQNNYITYNLTAFLPAYDTQSSMQAFQLPLHIREPLRSVFNTVTEGTTVSKCCGCFGNQVSGLFQIEVDRNEIHYTDEFKVRVFVDNTKGQFSFDRIVLTLTRRITKVSDSGIATNIDEDLGTFYRSKNAVSTGQKKKFTIDLTLPARIVEYTAIGNIISRSYYISLIGEVGCCYTDTRIMKHMVLNNEVPPTEQESLKQKQPQNWNPQVKSQVSFINLKPYLYNPAPDMKQTNQKGSLVPSGIMNLKASAVSLFRTQ